MNAPSSERRTSPREAGSKGGPRAAHRRIVDTVIAGRYRLVEHLGSGGMGTVWLGRDEALERPVAIKLMMEDASADPDLRQRFMREAKAAAALDSKHVVEIYDHGVDDGTPYIVMERLEGEDLRSRLRRVGVLGLPEVTEVVIQAGKALQRAQKAGIVHRDLKPANLFLARIDNEEIVKVLDFGVAKHTRGHDEAHATKTGVVLGSPPYMSPEQARGRALDHRADLWSLAAIAYRALTGHIPFTGESDGDIIVKICTESPDPPSRHVPAFGPEVDALFERAFAREPNERFQSAHEMSEAFCRLVGAEAPPTVVATLSSGARVAPPERQSMVADVPTTPLNTTPLNTTPMAVAEEHEEAETTLAEAATPARSRALVPLAMVVIAAAVVAVLAWPEASETGTSGTPEAQPSASAADPPSSPPAAVAEATTPTEPVVPVPSISPADAPSATSQPDPPPAPVTRRPRPGPAEPPPAKGAPSPKDGNPWGY